MKHKYKLTIEEGTEREEVVFADELEELTDGTCKFHLCTENPCPVRDQEYISILKNGFGIDGVNPTNDSTPINLLCMKCHKDKEGCKCEVNNAILDENNVHSVLKQMNRNFEVNK